MPRVPLRTTWIAALACVWFVAAPGSSAVGDELSFNRDVRPILSDKCFVCHGFDAKNRKADLRLDVADSALAERDGSFAIKPGAPDHSEVWARITSDDPEVMMPPPSTNKKLSPVERETIRRWIAEGAKYQKHWAFERPLPVAAPEVKRPDWARNPIDRFLLARLEREGLAPQPEASKETLVRRVAFTLTGLPPSLDDVQTFLADKSPDAYEKMVDRYLRSRHYGEEMARHWLDVARYADTHGLHLDNEREMWAYRDWVVKAFNDNLPFDQFTIWQLAGDLLPNATPEQLVATGFNRCNVTTSEGGSIAEEFLYRYAVDRAATTIQTWMGLTGGCAVCHDHKYDPLSTREFYSLYSFFYSAADPAMDGNINVTSPFVKLPKPGQQEAVDAARSDENTALVELEAYVAQFAYSDPQQAAPKPDDQKPDDQKPTEQKPDEEKPDAKPSATEPGKAKPADTKPAPVDVATVVFDDFFPLGATLRNTSRNAPIWTDRPAFATPRGRRALRQANSFFHENVVQSVLVPFVVPEAGRVTCWVRLDPHEPPQAICLLLAAQGGVTRRIVWGQSSAFANISPTELAEQGPLPNAGEWVELQCGLDDLGFKPGQTLATVTVQEAGGLVWWDGLTIHGRQSPDTDPLASFAAWRKALSGKSPPDVPGELASLLKDGPKENENADLSAKLRGFYLTRIARPTTPEWQQKRAAWDAAKAARMAAEDAIEGTFIFKDVDPPRQAFVMLRGQYNKPGDRVEPDVPAVLPALRKEKPDGRASRLDLARWLVDPEHPLTARVTVNRLWQQVFGVGLVKTSYDFGSQGEVPSHPELLDWLAMHYRESGWNTREFMRLLVTSAAFRQQSRVQPLALQKDPENRLYARGPRFRLDAEQIRDNALATSGLINLEMGGRGVMIYQPPNIWEPVGYGDSNTRYYLQDHGPALYRRSLYCFLKRTAPPPFMSNFDGPNREQSCSRRERSNTPLQALQLMNDTQHFEAARALAERVLAAEPKSADERLQLLMRIVLSRRATPEEATVLLAALDEQRKLFAAEPGTAEKAIRVGESAPRSVAPAVETAAWTVLANLVLNLDETVTRN